MPKRPLLFDFLMQNKESANKRNSGTGNNQSPFKLKKAEENLPSNAKINLDSMEELDEKVEEIIEHAHKKNYHASSYRIVQALCDLYKISSLSQIIVNGKQIDECGLEIPKVSSYFDIITKINNIIHCYVSTNVISTIVDIEATIVTEFKIPSFAELRIGLLSNFPLIIRYFTLNENSPTIFKLSAGMVIASLKKFKKQFPSKSRDIFSFLDYLCKINQIRHIVDLGIKIKEFSSLLDIVAKIEENEKKLLERESEKISKILVTELDEELRNLASVHENSRTLMIANDNNPKVENYGKPIIRALKTIPFEKFVENYEKFIYNIYHTTNSCADFDYKDFFASFKNFNYDEQFEYAKDFLTILKRLVDYAISDSTIVQISFYYSVINFLSINHGLNILNQNSSKTNQKQDLTKISSKLKDFLIKNPNITLTDLFHYENDHFPNSQSSLSLIFKNNELSSLINLDSQLKSNQFSLIDPYLRKWAGIVPEKFAEIQLLRNLKVNNISVLNLNDFSIYYSNFQKEFSNLNQINNIIDLNVFLCGYPPNPLDFTILKLNKDFTHLIKDFDDIFDKFLFIDNSTGFSVENSENFDSILQCFSDSLFVYDSVQKSMCKIRIFSDPEQLILEAGNNLDYLTVSSILISQLIQLANHWETSVYSLFVVWVTKMFKSLTIPRLEIFNFIIKITSVLEIRLAALILSRVLIPALLMVFDSGNFYEELFHAAVENNFAEKIMKISILENIPCLFLYNKYIEYLCTEKEIRNTGNYNSVEKIIDTSVEEKSEKLQIIVTKDPEIIPDYYCDNLIDQIRREQYLFGVENINPEIDQMLKTQINRLNRTLVHLSSDLYSNRHHFMFELFQNLDDAFLGKNVSKPTVAFIVSQSELVVLSNEPGFTPKDILAICDIANSSKDGSSQIGYKGIGFKSVFQVTDCPEIHSNGFHICFNFKKYGPLGYVMPESIPCKEEYFSELMNLLPKNFGSEWNTIFSLPFKENSRISSSSIFETICVDHILFLNNIKKVCLVNVLDKRINMFSREKGNNIIRITHNDSNSDYLYLTECIPKNSCEITLAFPVLDFKEIEYVKPQNLYCYLPLDVSPFNFIINAPFLVNSSRENIIDGDEWNVNILSHISNVFMSSINLLKSNASLFNVPYLYILSSFIPASKYYNPPFDWVAKSILKSINNTKFIEIDKSFYEPSSCVFIPNSFSDFFSEFSKFPLVDKEIFSKIMNLRIIQISQDISETLFHKIFSLGICEFNLEFFVSFIIKWYHSQSFMKLLLNQKTIGVVFGIIGIFIKSERFVIKSSIFKQIEGLNLIPTGTEFTSLSKGVFFLKKSDSLIQYVDLLENIVNIIDYSVLNICLEICNNHQIVYKTLSMLSIKPYDHSFMFNSINIEFFKRNNNIDKQIMFYKYATKLLKMFPDVSCEEIRKIGYVTTQNSEKWMNSSKIYKNNDLLKIFNNRLTSIYIPIIHEKFHIDKEVTDFLSNICLLDSFTLYEIGENNINYPSLIQMLKDVNYPNSDILNGGINDFTNFELVSILIHGNFDEKYLLADFIDSQWNLFSIHDPNRSSFLFLLKNHPWLPDASLSKSCKPNSLYNKNDRVKSFLGRNSDYLLSFYEFTNPELISFLKLRNDILPDDLISIFKHWCDSDFESSKTHLFSIYTELEILLLVNKNLFSFLNANKTPLVFIPDDLGIFMNSEDNDLIPGKFVSHLEVFMRDPVFSGTFLKFPTVSTLYKDKIYLFFRDILMVSDIPCFESYLVMFKSQFIPKIHNLEHSEVSRVISMMGCFCLVSFNILESLQNNKFLNIADLYEAVSTNLDPVRTDLLFSSLKNIKCILTDINQFEAPSNPNLYICDDFYIREKCSKNFLVDFVYIPESVFSQQFISPSSELIGIICICVACQIGLISKNFNISINVDFDSCQKDDISNRLVESVPFIYGYFKCNYLEFTNRYISTQSWNDMLKVECYSVKSSMMSISYSLGKSRVKIQSDVASCAVDTPTIYFFNNDPMSKGNDLLHTKIFNEFIRLFIKNPSPCLIRDLSSFIRDIMQVSVDKRSQHLTFFGFDSQNFLKHFNEFLRAYRPYIKRSSNQSISFRVAYNKDNDNNDSTESILKPVFQPCYKDDENFNNSQNETLINFPINNIRNSYTDQIGRWGEAVVNQMLHHNKEKLDLGDEIFEVDWVNETSESLLPYDFVLKTRNLKNIEKLVYLEVKASSNAKNSSFDLSFREIEFAEQCKGNYHVLKVTPKNNKSSFEMMKEDECEIKVYKNLIQHLNKKTIRIVAIPR